MVIVGAAGLTVIANDPQIVVYPGTTEQALAVAVALALTDAAVNVPPEDIVPADDGLTVQVTLCDGLPFPCTVAVHEDVPPPLMAAGVHVAATEATVVAVPPPVVLDAELDPHPARVPITRMMHTLRQDSRSARDEKSGRSCLPRIIACFPGRLKILLQMQKNGPRFRRGPSCLGSLVLRELGWRPGGRGAVGAELSLRGGGCAAYGRSAPVEEATPWGGVDSWAAKLFSINRMCTLLVLTGWVPASPAVATWALPSAT